MRKFLLIALLFILGCTDFGHPKFYFGEMVKSVLSGQKGQVLDVHCYVSAKRDLSVCRYKVRFVYPQETTSTHFIGPDDPIEKNGLATLWMEEFELTK
mgnify:CR=1 FL=1